LNVGQTSSLPYVATGLVIILLFWSRSLIHTLTLIRWPLEFVHNFFYIACTLIEAVAFTHLNDPLAWFVLTATYALVVWSLFVYVIRTYIRLAPLISQTREEWRATGEEELVRH